MKISLGKQITFFEKLFISESEKINSTLETVLEEKIQKLREESKEFKRELLTKQLTLISTRDIEKKLIEFKLLKQLKQKEVRQIKKELGSTDIYATQAGEFSHETFLQDSGRKLDEEIRYIEKKILVLKNVLKKMKKGELLEYSLTDEDVHSLQTKEEHEMYFREWQRVNFN